MQSVKFADSHIEGLYSAITRPSLVQLPFSSPFLYVCFWLFAFFNSVKFVFSFTIQYNEVNKISRKSLSKIFCSIRESCAVLSGKQVPLQNQLKQQCQDHVQLLPKKNLLTQLHKDPVIVGYLHNVSPVNKVLKDPNTSHLQSKRK